MPLRVIAGSEGGRRLQGPPRTGVRPTADRVRESMFEIIGARGLDVVRVLDLYSGTGAIGIEALSRGAAHCDFVESDTRACDVIRENLARTTMLDRSRLLPLTVARAIARLEEPYDLVVADPPYEYDRAEMELTQVIEKRLLAPEGVLIVEHSKRREWPETLGDRQKLDTRRYGDSSITLYGSKD